ncbi:hypothetical protein QO034_21140 [Sedimentitalea sp. JM2-8]|uniref:Uncharacterized protein n=1 Tax=Sedimentitalea xiamensis TaxID=3050037 RepID=A0ABT7FKA9_9RHOB|nr:hypothetical protein [Sedimentitalea xiamensis]MDK3075577.1 hypothetical protein [Sedimentitalea xiamensis]
MVGFPAPVAGGWFKGLFHSHFSGRCPRSGNLLADLLISSISGSRYSLPGLPTAMARGEIDGFVALRPHQRPARHMFLVHHAALALDRNRQNELPKTEAEWATLLRGLTQEFPEDDPWHLIVADRNNPAFMQPPAPETIVPMDQRPVMH